MRPWFSKTFQAIEMRPNQGGATRSLATSPSVHHILLITEVKQGQDLLVLGWVTAPKMQPDVDKILFANGCLSIRSGRQFWISIMQQLTSSPSIVLFYTKNLVSSQREPKSQKKKLTKVCLLASGSENFGSQRGQ